MRSHSLSALALVATSLPALAAVGHDLEEGDVVVSLGQGRHAIYDNDGNFIKMLDDGLGGFTTNACYDPVGDRLYTTNFTNSTIVVYDGNSPNNIVDSFFVGGDGATAAESVIMDAAGDLYVGYQGGDVDIKKYTAGGTFLDTFDVDASGGGSCILSLAPDQQTMFYTGNGPAVRRYDIVNEVQLPDFSASTGFEYDFAMLPPYDGSGGLVLAGTTGVRRFDAGGTDVQTYQGAGQWYGCSLDPSANSFWVSDSNGQVLRINLDTGAVEDSFNAGSFETYGTLVIGERDGNDAPNFIDPTPCNEVVMASVGAEVTYVVSVGDEDAGDEVTLSVANVPAGASHMPDLPASGPSVTTTFSWTPGNGDVGDHVIVYTATDGDETTTCAITVSVAECHLALGTGMGTDTFDIGGHEFDTQLSGIVASFPVLLDDIPVFPVPKFAEHIWSGALVSPPSGPTAMIEFTAQVLMFNPEVFPENPEQSTPGLAITIWSNGDVTSAPFGERDGMDIWLETFVDENGRKFFQIPFSIDGM